MWVNPHFPAQESAELPVQSKWKAQAHNNTHAGRELRGRLHSKLLQQLNLNIKLISLRGLITALIAAQMITEWDITPVISIYYRIDIRYYCICHYLYQSVPVNEDEWEAGDKKSSCAQVTPTALWGNVCVYMGSTSEELCLVLTHILIRASSHGTDPASLPNRMSCKRCFIPAHRPGAGTCHLRAKGQQEVPPKERAVLSSTHIKASTCKPKSHLTRQTFQTQPCGLQRTVCTKMETCGVLAEEELLFLLASS